MKTLAPWLVMASILIVIVTAGTAYATSYYGQGGPPNPTANVTTAYKYFQAKNATGQLYGPPLSITLPHTIYHQGENIYLSGHIRDPQNKTAVTFKVIDPTNHIVTVGQTLPNSYGNFSATFKAAGPGYVNTGNYLILAVYDGYAKANATFQYQGAGNLQTCGSNQLTAWVLMSEPKKGYCITYHFDGGGLNPGISDGVLDVETKRLFLNINAPAAGDLTLKIPRAILDSKNNDTDKLFIVEMDGRVINDVVTEFPAIESRTVLIPFASGQHNIDVIGTSIIPEFPISGVILVMAISGIIIFSYKTRTFNF